MYTEKIKSIMLRVIMAGFVVSGCAIAQPEGGGSLPKNLSKMDFPKDVEMVVGLTKYGDVSVTYGLDDDSDMAQGTACQLCTEELEKVHGPDCKDIQTTTIMSKIKEKTKDVKKQMKMFEEETANRKPVCGGLVRKVVIGADSKIFLRTHGSHHCYYVMERGGDNIYEAPAGCSNWGH